MKATVMTVTSTNYVKHPLPNPFCMALPIHCLKLGSNMTF